MKETSNEPITANWAKLFSDDPYERYTALEELTGPIPFHLVRTLALYDPDDMVRSEAQAITADVFETRAIEILLRAAWNDGYVFNRRDAWAMLGEIGIDRAVLDECLSDVDKEEIEKVGALVGLLYLGAHKGIEVDQWLSHDWPSVREMLANGIRGIEKWPYWLGPYLEKILPPKIAREEDKLALESFLRLKKRLETPGYMPKEDL